MGKADKKNQAVGQNLPQTREEQNMSLMTLALNNQADIATIERLVALQEQYEAKEARKDFFDALSKFQSHVLSIKKNGKADYASNKGGRVQYSYAKLADIANGIRKPLGKCELSYRFEIVTDNNRITVSCIACHVSGHTETSSMTGPLDQTGNKNAIQQAGSTITYLKKYTLEAMFGLSTTDDDVDGRGADENWDHPSQDQNNNQNHNTQTDNHEDPRVEAANLFAQNLIKKIKGCSDGNSISRCLDNPNYKSKLESFPELTEEIEKEVDQHLFELSQATQDESQQNPGSLLDQMEEN